MKEWLHFILDEDGRSYYEDTNGSVSNSVTPKPLVHTPDGWKDISIAYERDMKKLGLLKSFTFPLQFFLDGVKILRNGVYRQFIELKLFYLITKRKIELVNGNTQFKDYHTKWYRGQIDLATFKDDEFSASCTIGPLGLEKQLKAFENQDFEFPLSDREASDIEMDGLNLYSKALYEISEVLYDDSVFRHTHIVPFGKLSSEGIATGVALFDQTIGSVEGYSTPNQFYENSQNFHLAVDVSSQPVSVSYTGKIRVRITRNTLHAAVRYFFRTSTNRVFTITGQADGINPTVTIPVNITILVQPGEKVFLAGVVFGGFTAGSIGFKYEFLDDSEITVTFATKYDKSYIRGFQPAILADKILEKITGSRGMLNSTLLTSSDYKNFYITSGDGIRSLSNANVKISFSKLFDIFRVNAFAGQSIENGKLVIEDGEQFLNYTAPSQVVHLGEVRSCKPRIATELLFNTIDIGHSNKDVEGVEGKYRFNNIHQYSVPRTSTATKFSLVSPAMADPYIIEHTRINFDGKTTTDADKDNDLFVIHGKPTAVADVESLAEDPGKVVLASDDEVQFKHFNNIGMTPNSTFSQFTWFGAASVAVRLKVYLVPLSTPSGQSVTVRLKVNNIQIASVVVVGDANNTAALDITRILNTGDFVSVTVSSPSGSISIVSCILSMTFATLNIVRLFRETYSTLTGVSDNTIFNIELLTPKRLLRKWKKYLNSVCYRLEGKDYQFLLSDRNPELFTVLGSVTTDEDSNEPITSDILFKPFIFEVETQVPVDLVDIIDTDPSVPFDFEWGGNTYKGFMLKGGIAPDDNRNQVFLLLCTPDTDETKLIG